MCGDAYGTPKDPNVFYLFNGINVSKSEWAHEKVIVKSAGIRTSATGIDELWVKDLNGINKHNVWTKLDIKRYKNITLLFYSFFSVSDVFFNLLI